MTSVLIRERGGAQTHTGKGPVTWGQRVAGDTASQGPPRMAGSHQQLGQGHRTHSARELREGSHPADTLISVF